MVTDNVDDDSIYIPDEDEQREIDEVLNREELEKETALQPKVKNRVYHHFNSEDHWVGWLRINGISWQ